MALIRVLNLLAVCFHVNIHFAVSLMQPVLCIFEASLRSRQNVWDVLHDDVSLLLRSSEEIVIYFSDCKKEVGIQDSLDEIADRERRHHHRGFVRFERSRHEVHLPGAEGEQDTCASKECPVIMSFTMSFWDSLERVFEQMAGDLMAFRVPNMVQVCFG